MNLLVILGVFVGGIAVDPCSRSRIDPCFDPCFIQPESICGEWVQIECFPDPPDCFLVDPDCFLVDPDCFLVDPDCICGICDCDCELGGFGGGGIGVMVGTGIYPSSSLSHPFYPLGQDVQKRSYPGRRGSGGWGGGSWGRGGSTPEIVIPEPKSFVLWGLGLVLLWAVRFARYRVIR